LVQYRQHDAQQIGGKPESLLDKYRRRKREGPGLYAATAENYAAALERLRPLAARLTDRCVLGRLERKVQHWRTRARMRVGRPWRLPIIARELLRGSYSRYSSRSPLTRIIHVRGRAGAACATRVRSASEGRPLPLPRLRFGLVFGHE
jgi:hypothetical protein